MTSSPDRLLLTPAEVAAMLGTTVDALRKQRTRDTGPAYVRQGRRIRYPRLAVVAYLEEHTVYTSEQPRPRRTTTAQARVQRRRKSSR